METWLTKSLTSISVLNYLLCVVVIALHLGSLIIDFWSVSVIN